VIVASPATAPVRSPRNRGLPVTRHSIASQTIPANEAAMSVLRNATAVTASTRNSLPALKPYQPNHRRPVPRATSGMLWAPSSGVRRRPTYSTDARAAVPAIAWTTMPPAKSSTPRSARKPPPQIMCTNGK
jgi:hypothetical protein